MLLFLEIQMSFNQFKLDRSVLQSRGIFNKYIYETNDNITAVQVADYFSKSRFIEIDGDNWEGGTIDASCSDGFVIGSISGGTLTAITTPPSTLLSQVVVTQASDLSGTFAGGDPLLSTVEYLLDGIIDMGSQSIEVPQGGLSLSGFNFDVSKLTSSASGYTMFISPSSGSGNVLGMDYAVEVTGSGSQVYDLVSDTGFEAFEFTRVNYNNCTSLGEIDNYRQGLEIGTGRFGGAPTLTLNGIWVGGYFIDTSIVRGLDSGMTGGLFEVGAAFLMSSRFRSNMNIDLPASANFFDFAPSNFVNPSTVQIAGAIVTRNGVFDATDTNITPNMSEGDLVASWSDNIGMPNTFEGGSIGVTTETATVIAVAGTFVDLAATLWTSLDLQHFDNTAGNQLRHLGNTPREYKVIASFAIGSIANNVLTLRVEKWDNSASSFVTVLDQSRQVNNFVATRDVAFFNININVELDQNDYVKLMITNQTAANNVTAENDSYYIVEMR